MKAKFILVLLAFVFLATTGQFYIRPETSNWNCDLVGVVAADAECKALEAGRQFFITDIWVGSNTSTATSWRIDSGTGTNCGSATTAVMPFTAVKFFAPPNTAAPALIHFTTPLEVTVGHAICVFGLGTNTTNMHIAGFRK